MTLIFEYPKFQAIQSRNAGVRSIGTVDIWENDLGTREFKLNFTEFKEGSKEKRVLERWWGVVFSGYTRIPFNTGPVIMELSIFLEVFHACREASFRGHDLLSFFIWEAIVAPQRSNPF